MVRTMITITVVVAAAAAVRPQAPKRYVPGEILVKFAGGSKTSEILRVKGAKTIEQFADLGWRRIKLPKGTPVENALKEFGKTAGVEAVQPNYYYHLLATPLERALPRLLAQASTRGYRIIVRAASAERIEHLNAALWT